MVALDEKESGIRALLNLGHTFGHAIEAAERILVVATRHDATLIVEISDDKMLATGTLTLAKGGATLSFDEAKKN